MTKYVIGDLATLRRINCIGQGRHIFIKYEEYFSIGGFYIAVAFSCTLEVYERLAQILTLYFIEFTSLIKNYKNK